MFLLVGFLSPAIAFQLIVLLWAVMHAEQPWDHGAKAPKASGQAPHAIHAIQPQGQRVGAMLVVVVVAAGVAAIPSQFPGLPGRFGTR